MKKKYLLLLSIIGAVTLSACSLGKAEEQSTPPKATEETGDEAEESLADLLGEDQEDTSEGTLETEADDASETEESAEDEQTSKASEDDGFAAEAKERAAKEAGTDIENARYCQAGDFDGDGEEEAFVFVGSEVDEAWQSCEGDIYFVTKDKCENLKNGSFYAYEEGTIRVFDTGSKKFIGFSDVYATAAPTNLYYVENGEPKESIVSGIGSFFIPDYIDGYCINLDSYDNIGHYENGEESFTGHTWKNYYFYYDETIGDFKEYVGYDITEDELNTACNMDLTGEIRSEGYEIDSMFKRDNGIYHVNYSKRTDNEDGSYDIEYGNATYNANAGEFIQVWEPDKNDWKSSDYGGTILKTITE